MDFPATPLNTYAIPHEEPLFVPTKTQTASRTKKSNLAYPCMDATRKSLDFDQYSCFKQSVIIKLAVWIKFNNRKVRGFKDFFKGTNIPGCTQRTFSYINSAWQRHCEFLGVTPPPSNINSAWQRHSESLGVTPPPPSKLSISYSSLFPTNDKNMFFIYRAITFSPAYKNLQKIVSTGKRELQLPSLHDALIIFKQYEKIINPSLTKKRPSNSSLSNEQTIKQKRFKKSKLLSAKSDGVALLTDASINHTDLNREPQKQQSHSHRSPPLPQMPSSPSIDHTFIEKYRSYKELALSPDRQRSSLPDDRLLNTSPIQPPHLNISDKFMDDLTRACQTPSPTTTDPQNQQSHPHGLQLLPQRPSSPTDPYTKNEIAILNSDPSMFGSPSSWMGSPHSSPTIGFDGFSSPPRSPDDDFCTSMEKLLALSRNVTSKN